MDCVLDRAHEDDRVDRLREAGRGPDRGGSCTGLVVLTAGKQDHRNLDVVRAEPAMNLQTAGPRHLHIEHETVRSLAAE